jgi:AraC family transcriptional regulator of adaptative response / DNA-3-methyladenine glycosylase II
MTNQAAIPLPSTAICDQARLARDARFDGRFFTAVLTTGIYCRPVCPAPQPRREHVRYYATAMEAFAAGFRPCLRCRPESAPESPAWLGTETTVRRALRLLHDGAAQYQDFEALADRLGVSGRHLRRLFKQHLGVSPQEYVQHRNLLFAKKLLSETALPVLDVAFASGFNSRRRFNAAFQEKLQLNPGALRQGRARQTATGCALLLHYRPPYAWDTLLAFYRQRAIVGVEVVSETTYARSFQFEGAQGWFRLAHLPEQHALRAEIHCDDLSQLQRVVALIRRQFDLDANPDLIQAALATHPVLRKVVKQLPGLRVPGIAGEFEALIRAIAGQQVSVAAARTLLQRLCERCACAVADGSDATAPRLLFPSPEALLRTPLDGLGFTTKRAGWMHLIAQRYAQGFTARLSNLDESVARLQELPGIGAWSAHYIAMRAFGEPDAFPTADLGLLNALRNPERPSARELQQLAQAWRPWRAYATLYLWHTLV